jgi:ribonuclease BN (tRNA processing enzyme)
MRLKVLGCSGGIGGDLCTSALLVDDDILIDAGTGVFTLGIEQLRRIDHVFITHSHLDHITSLPLMVDSVGGLRDTPLTVYATEATVSILKGHIFNWEIWPDFSRIPTVQAPFMRFEIITVGTPVNLGGRLITAVPAEHAVPAVGYHIDSGQASLVYTGDTTRCEALWEYLNGVDNLRYLLIETAFSNYARNIAVLSKHLCPSMLAEELAQLRRPAEIWITHLKPGEAEKTMLEIGQCVLSHRPRMLENGQVFEF